MRRLVCAVVLGTTVIPCLAAWTWPVRGPVLQTFSFDPAHPYAAGEHRGIAIGVATGTQVVAPAAGTVTFAGTVPTNGRSVTILTPSGLAVSLTHLGSIVVAQDATVAEGDAVGTVGPSGTPELDVPYVHLGIRQASNDQGYLDPLAFLPVLAPPAPPQPEPQPAPAPTPVPATPPAAPVVATPQSSPPPAPAPVSSPSPSPSPQPAPTPTPAPAPAPVATTPSVPGVTVTAAPAGLAVKASPLPSAPVHVASFHAAARIVAPVAGSRPAVTSVPHSPHVRGAPRSQAGVAPGHRRVPGAAPLASPSPLVTGTGSAAATHSHARLAVGLGALAAAVAVALLWIRWRLRPPGRREGTALV